VTLPPRFQPTSGEQPFLLNPGPINVSQRVAESLLTGDMCHREPEYAALQAETRALLQRAFAHDRDWTAVLITGSGTAALEAAVASSVSPTGKLLILSNGVYGERQRLIAEAHGIPHRVLEAPWTQPHDPADVQAVLREDAEIEVVAGVHHETTTGLLNPVQRLAEVCREESRPYLLDAISGLGGEAIDVPNWGVDICVGTANKCIRGIPGMAFVLVRRAHMEKMKTFPPRTLYLHLPSYFAKQEADGVPFTPAIQANYALREALRELLEEGVEQRVAAMQATSARIRAGLEALGLELYLPAELRSNTITTIKLPAGWDYDRLHDALRAEGYVIYAGQGQLREEAFRISNMGVMTEADYNGLLAALGRVLGTTAS
jgi:2-aminoethylphosphonate-pyruvate transaminase